MSDSEETRRLKDRIQRLAQQKSRYEMLSLLYERIGGAEGFDKGVSTVLSVVMDLLGGSNVELYYRLGDSWCARDVLGRFDENIEGEDPLVKQVIESSAFGSSEASRNEAGHSSLPAVHWCFPLVGLDGTFGAVKMSSIVVNDSTTCFQMKTFFRQVGLNLSAQLHSHIELREREARYRDLFQNMPDGFITLQEIKDELGVVVDFEILETNQSLDRMAGMEKGQMSGLLVSDLIAPSELTVRELNSLFGRAEKTQSLEHNPHGDIWVSCSVYRPAANQVSVIVRDVSSRHRTDEELRKVQRLESLGVVAGGIAHDFNNLLQGIFGYIDLAKDNADDPALVIADLSSALAAHERATDLTNQLLTFSKGGAPVKKAVAMEPLVREAVGFALHGKTVSADIQIEEEGIVCDVDEGQLNQVIGNIVINAVQAMPTGGRLGVCLKTMEVSQGEYVRVSPGIYTTIELSDTGTGIEPQHLERIFDPFFTTKQLGSGLGLATAFSIVAKHGGHLEVESEQGRGATFRVLLPPSDQSIEESPAPRSSVYPVFSGRVLIMDDEVLVQDVAKAIFERFGLEVESVCDSSAAIEAYKVALSQGRGFDLVILDLTMPGDLGGVETLARLRSIDEQVCAVVSSGYSDNPAMSRPEEFGFVEVLPKPYFRKSVEKLLSRIFH